MRCVVDASCSTILSEEKDGLNESRCLNGLDVDVCVNSHGDNVADLGRGGYCAVIVSRQQALGTDTTRMVAASTRPWATGSNTGSTFSALGYVQKTFFLIDHSVQTKSTQRGDVHCVRA